MVSQILNPAVSEFRILTNLFHLSENFARLFVALYLLRQFDGLKFVNLFISGLEVREPIWWAAH